MDPLILAVATAIVGAMATDGWQHARDLMIALWRRHLPERAVAVEAELEDVRVDVLLARDAGNTDIELELIADWRRRVLRLLTERPEAAEDLRSLLDQDLHDLLPPQERERITRIKMTATTGDHGRVYQAGRDQHITEG